MNENEKRVYQVLDDLSIAYRQYRHDPVETIQDIKEKIENLQVVHFKNIFLRNSKGDKHFLVLMDSNKRANTRALARKIGSSRLSFASNDRLQKYLGLEGGAVSPLGLINDINKEVEVLVDKDLGIDGQVTLHPNVNTASITMAYSDLVRFLEWSGNKVQYMEIPS